jgi:hypothetical protein
MEQHSGPTARPLRATLCGVALSVAAMLPAIAQEPLSADAFEQFTQGRTLYYFNNGTAYGVERYLPGRRVIWSFLDGQCQDGTWYASGPFICFEYDTGLGPQCWQFYLENGQLRAVFEDGSESATPYVAEESPDDMLCLGPEVGV